MRAVEHWPDGTEDVIHIESLQPVEWIESQELQVGSTVAPPLDLQEMGLRAEIVEIRSCPEIHDGPGRVVLNTVNHLNPRVLELTIQDADGDTETLRATETHKLFSATRNTWLSATDLQHGEQLNGLHGPVTVTRITPLPGTHRVYNLTVQGEHLYRVANSGVLVHNNGCDELLYRFSAKKGTISYALRRGESAMSMARVADFASPAEAFKAVMGRPPGINDTYRVVNVGTLRRNGYYPVYDGGKHGLPFGHVSVYGGAFGQQLKNVFDTFEYVFRFGRRTSL